MLRDRWKNFLTARCHDLQELLFPPACVGCGDLLKPFQSDRPIFCPICRTRFELGRIPVNTIFGEDPLCAVHIAPLSYQAGRVNGVPERLIYTIKHKRYSRVFSFVVKQLEPHVRVVWEEGNISPDNVIWVYPPRRSKAIRKDGFDQARELAKRSAKVCGGTCRPLLKRRRRTKEQKRLNAKERRINTAGAYQLPVKARRYIKGRTVMLVDDVCTTGTTLRAAAELMKKAGAKTIIWVTVSKAERYFEEEIL